MNIVVTGAYGFLGKNLTCWLEEQGQHRVVRLGRQHDWGVVAHALASADLVFHLAGANRPAQEEDYEVVNVGLTRRLCDEVQKAGRTVPVVFASSIQATNDTPYGKSKRHAEAVLAAYAHSSGARVAIYRLKNVFGKWSRPNYNSVVATFCHNIARDLPITLSDPAKEIELVYVDDVVRAFVSEIGATEPGGVHYREVQPSWRVTLKRLAEIIRSFQEIRATLMLPDLSDPFTRNLYSTLLSYKEPHQLAYQLDKKVDARGALAEVLKSLAAGQVFISRTAPGIARGNHYHHTKVEKFLVIDGEAVVRLRHLHGSEVHTYAVRGEDFRVIDIPPGYTHSIENVGSRDLVTLFWANEPFDPARPDTFPLPV